MGFFSMKKELPRLIPVAYPEKSVFHPPVLQRKCIGEAEAGLCSPLVYTL